MFETIKRSWQRFKADPPGQRFQQQFKRRHEVARTLLQKALVVGGGVLLTGVGIFLFFLPGPGVLFVLLGAVLIAQQSVTVARGLDWTEIRLRKLLAQSFGAVFNRTVQPAPWPLWELIGSWGLLEPSRSAAEIRPVVRASRRR